MKKSTIKQSKTKQTRATIATTIVTKQDNIPKKEASFFSKLTIRFQTGFTNFEEIQNKLRELQLLNCRIINMEHKLLLTTNYHKIQI